MGQPSGGGHHEEQKQETETGSVENQARPSGSDNAKAAVLASLHSLESQRSYRHAIDEFVGWYCSEPRLPFNKTVVTRYRIHLEDRRLAPGTTNVRLAAVRRFADEAADAGLLSPELAPGIRRVKGSKRLGIRLGNWLTAEQARCLWQLPNAETLKSKRDRAILALLLGCVLRRRELCDLTLDHLQRREEHWAIIDLVGKGRHIRHHSDRREAGVVMASPPSISIQVSEHAT